MDLLVLLFLIALVGVSVWAITEFVPMPPSFKTLIIAVAIIGVLILLWNIFNGYAPHIHVGK